MGTFILHSCMILFAVRYVLLVVTGGTVATIAIVFTHCVCMHAEGCYQNVTATGLSNAGSVAHLATETVEEMMSITDGQLVLKGGKGDGRRISNLDKGETLQLDVLSSLSRMGTRAYPLALKDLAPKVSPLRCL
jgi:hypothetical protein